MSFERLTVNMSCCSYLGIAETLDISSVDFDNSIPWLQGVALLPVPDSLYYSHTAPSAPSHQAEAEASVFFSLCQDHWDQLPPTETPKPAAHTRCPR